MRTRHKSYSDQAIDTAAGDDGVSGNDPNQADSAAEQQPDLRKRPTVAEILGECRMPNPTSSRKRKHPSEHRLPPIPSPVADNGDDDGNSGTIMMDTDGRGPRRKKGKSNKTSAFKDGNSVQKLPASSSPEEVEEEEAMQDAKVQVRIEEITIDDLAEIYFLGEKVFRSHPELHRTWDAFEVVSCFSSDSEHCLVARLLVPDKKVQKQQQQQQQKNAAAEATTDNDVGGTRGDGETGEQQEMRALENTSTIASSESASHVGMHSKIVAFALGTVLEKTDLEKFGYLQWIGTSLRYQRMGIATKLFTRFRELMEQAGVNLLLADTNESNIAARHFLNKMGFGNIQSHLYMSLNLGRRKDDDAEVTTSYPIALRPSGATNAIRDASALAVPSSAQSSTTTTTTTTATATPRQPVKVTIRHMEIDDLADAFHLGEQVFTAKFLNLYRTWNEYEVTDLFLSDDQFCLVAEIKDAIVGFAMGYIISKRYISYGYLVWLAVSPDVQRAGIAFKLFSRFREIMEEHGVRMILIDTQADNVSAIRFFERQGFAHPSNHQYLSLKMSPVDELTPISPATKRGPHQIPKRKPVPRGLLTSSHK